MTGQKTQKRVVLHGQTPGEAPAIQVKALAGSRRFIYLLSPADSSGKRAELLLSTRARFDLAQRLQTTGITLGEAFSFMSSLYFRGKLAYAQTFSLPIPGIPGTLVITPSRGLMRPETLVTLSELLEISGARIVAQNPKYREPLERDLRLLSETIGQGYRVVLLGSIATRKYIPLLLEILSDRLLVPRLFVGLGNMSRGALLLRCSRERRELEYIPVAEVLSKRT
jgi:hypothetical protein